MGLTPARRLWQPTYFCDFRQEVHDFKTGGTTKVMGGVTWTAENEGGPANNLEVGASGIYLYGASGTISGTDRTSPLIRAPISGLGGSPRSIDLLRFVLDLTVDTLATANVGAVQLIEDVSATVNNSRLFIGAGSSDFRLGSHRTNANTQQVIATASALASLPTCIETYNGWGADHDRYGSPDLDAGMPKPFSLTAVSRPYASDVNTTIDIDNDARFVLGVIGVAKVYLRRLWVFKARLDRY